MPDSRYPVLLNLAERLVVIVGGGGVGARKARGLIACGAGRVRVISPDFDAHMPEAVERVAREFVESDLDGAALVFAATDSPQVNARVVRDARSRGIPVNRADDEDDADFITPAMHHAGPILVTVSAGSAALSASIRDRIAARFDSRWAPMSGVMRELRPRLVAAANARSYSPDQRREVFNELTSDEALDLAPSGADAVWKWIISRHPELFEAT